MRTSRTVLTRHGAGICVKLSRISFHIFIYADYTPTSCRRDIPDILVTLDTKRQKPHLGFSSRFTNVFRDTQFDLGLA